MSSKREMERTIQDLREDLVRSEARSADKALMLRQVARQRDALLKQHEALLKQIDAANPQPVACEQPAESRDISQLVYRDRAGSVMVLVTHSDGSRGTRIDLLPDVPVSLSGGLRDEFRGERGKAEQVKERTWDFFISRKMVDGSTHLTRVGNVGYYVRDGRNHISGVQAIQRWLAR